MRGILWRQHEHRFGQIEFTRDSLHGAVVEPFGLQDDGQRIAGKAPAGEDIESDKAAFHGASPQLLRGGSTMSDRQRLARARPMNLCNAIPAMT